MNLEVQMSAKQWECIHSTARHTLVTAGVGFGKTVAGAWWMLLRALRTSKVNCLIVARDYTQIKDAVHPAFLEALEDMGFKEERDFTYHKSEYHYKFYNGSKITMRSANNYNSALRAASYQYIWSDETEYYVDDAYKAMIARLRGGHRLGIKEQILVTSTPVGYGPVHKHFHEDGGKLDKLIIHATSLESPWLDDEYIQSLKSLYSPKGYRQEVLAERLNLASNPVYEEFEYKKNVTKCSHVLQEKDQLYAFLDYNVNRYPCVFMVFKNNHIYAIDEIFIQDGGGTISMAQHITNRYPGRDIVLIGDSSGNNKNDVAADKTNYQIFNEYLNLHPQHYHNPPRNSRINAVNSHLFHSRITIDPKCKVLIGDLEKVSYNEKGEPDQKKDKTLTHMSDAFGYGVWKFMPLRDTTKPLGHIKY